MTQGVGIDIVDLVGFRAQLADEASCFVDGVFTPSEQATCANRPSANPATHLGARYAAKEAFVKAWSSLRRGQAPQLTTVDLREIEVLTDSWGRPSIVVHGAVALATDALGIGGIEVSLSHDGGYACAVVVVTTA